jgi:tetratricopeptide (TPR) repeat protein
MGNPFCGFKRRLERRSRNTYRSGSPQNSQLPTLAKRPRTPTPTTCTCAESITGTSVGQRRFAAPSSASRQRYQEMPPLRSPGQGWPIPTLSLTLSADGDPSELWTKARSAADEAVRLQGALAESRTSSAGVGFWLDWDWRRAEQDLRGAVLLNPSYAFGHHYLATVLSNLGRHTEALAIMGNARRLDPLSPALHALGSIVFPGQKIRRGRRAGPICPRAQLRFLARASRSGESL